MHSVLDVFACEREFVAPSHGRELTGRNPLIVKKYITNVFCVHDDVDMMSGDVDVLVVEGGESDSIDALLDGGNPNHGWVANAVAIAGSVVKVNCGTP